VIRLPKRCLPLAVALGAGAFMLPAMAWSAETTVEAVNEPGGYGANHRWVPEREVVTAGSAVTFRNPTDVPHGVEWYLPRATPSCEEGPGKVPVGTSPAASGTKWSGACTFSQPGSYTFYCTVHGTEMQGTIKVTGTASATTDEVTEATQTTATLNGTIKPEGNTTEYHFEYGTTSVSEHVTSTVTLGFADFGSHHVSAALTALSPSTKYHAELVAVYGAAKTTVLGGERTFTTATPIAPAVATGHATAVNETEATLEGSVDPEGEATEYLFEYGTNSSYGHATAVTSLPADNLNHAVTMRLTGLAPGTEYHFRLVATNARGTSKGADETLRTLLAPTVVTKPASSVTQTAATLNATVNPNNAEVSECKLEYGTTTSYGSSALCTPAPGSGGSPVTVSAPLSGLSPNTTYHFRVSATNAGGTSKGEDQTFKTALPNPPTVKTEPATAVTKTSTTLNATVNPNGGEVSQCKFEYGTTEAYGSSAPCSSLPGSGTSPVAVSASISGLAPLTTYHFKISATNAGGITTGLDETLKTQPSAPTVATGGFMATQASGVLTGAVNPNGSAVTDCHFEYGNTNLYGSSVPCSGLPGSGTQVVEVSARVGALFANATYHFRIVATNAAGTSYGADSVFFTPANPPSGLLGSPALGGGSFGGGSAGSIATGGVSSAQIEALLLGQLVPSGKAAKIRVLLRSGGFALIFTAPEAGLIVIDWYDVPPGAKLARKVQPRSLLVAAGKLSFSAKGTARMKIKLTVAGTHLLRHTKQLKITAKGTFTPRSNSPITATRAFLLKP
jgi:plastocyanin/phosphodiesterase/alkaline phosphatase D-like protein